MRWRRSDAGAKVQLGGGIRDMAMVEAWLDADQPRHPRHGCTENPALVREAAAAFPGRIVAGADARDGMIAAEGWVETSEVSALELVRRFEHCGVAAVIFTDIGRDGAFRALIWMRQQLCPGSEPACHRLRRCGLIDDIRALVADESGIEGVITGRAIYDGRLDLAEALRMVEAA